MVCSVVGILWSDMWTKEFKPSTITNASLNHNVLNKIQVKKIKMASKRALTGSIRKIVLRINQYQINGQNTMKFLIIMTE